MQIKTLFVDDETSLLDQGEIFLERMDESLEVHPTTTVSDALEMIEENDFDAIVSDYQMPETDGLEFLKEMRKERNNDIPFIIFTGKGREEVAMKALNLGADRYFQKRGDPKSQYGLLVEGIEQEVKHHKTEKALEESEKREKLFSSSLQQASLEVFWITPEGKIVFTNDTARDRLGYSKDELDDMYVWDIDPKYPKGKRQEFWEELKEKGRQNFISSHRKSDGETYPVEITSQYIVHNDVEYEFAFAKDISEQKKAEKRVRENKKKLENLHKISAELETCETKKEVYEHTVKVAEEILDFDICAINVPEGDVMMAVAMSSKFPEDASSVEEPLSIDNSLAGRTYHEKKSFLVDDKKENEYVNPTTDEFESGISVPIGKFAVFQAVSTEVDDFDEKDLRMTELLMDHVSEALKRVEVKEREEFLHSLLRHDVGNKNQIIKGYLELMKEYDLPEEVKDFLDKAEHAADDGIEIIEKVRKLREIKEEEEIGRIDLSLVMDKILSEHQGKLEEKGISIDLDKCDIKVKGGSLLEELFSNLLENSIHHSDCEEIKISSQIEEDECVVIVEDDGIGISDDLKGKIFEKGFRDGETAGTGLGLYMVKEIGENYDGEIKVEDSELGGARFEVRLKKYG